MYLGQVCYLRTIRWHGCIGWLGGEYPKYDMYYAMLENPDPESSELMDEDVHIQIES